jgi:predicted Ser/Thr protein kinase
MSNPSAHPAPEFLALQTALAGRYSLERELGRGGMGIVFLAREVALDRMVALKLLPPEMAARPGLKERFLTEARTAARLSHPNIVPIYAVDEVDGFVFFAMAYVEGRTLGERIRERGPLSNAEAVRLLQEVSWALGYAHLNGLVHRDVKPENILLDDGSGRAMVTDFGIAVLAQAKGAEITTEVLGTAEFMSPEQAKGAEVDARSDLYSLGCVGFYALSGRVPFTGDTPAAILGQHVVQPPPRLASVAPQVPPGVATALDRCLRKEPGHRFSGGEALADALSPDVQIDRELPVPLRVFIKQSRGSESTLSWSLVGQALVGVGLVSAVVTGTPGLVVAGLALSAVALTGLPLGQLVREARRLLKAGFTPQDAVDALLQDVGRRNEEFRFQVGHRVTWVDRLARVLTVGGFGLAVGSFVAGYLGVDWAFGLFAVAFNVGVPAALYRELRARGRGDVMGERFLRFWKSKFGKLLFKLGGLKLKRVATSVSGLHRPTEVAIGLAADRLFEELPKETRKTLKGLPETVKALEDDAQGIRHQVEELDAVLAEIGDDDPSRPSSEDRARIKGQVEATRDEAREKLKEAVAALETIRLGLLHMHAGSGTVESVTMEIQAARGLSDDMENLLAGHREVERILQERRLTGVFTNFEEEEPRSERTPPAENPD